MPRQVRIRLAKYEGKASTDSAEIFIHEDLVFKAAMQDVTRSKYSITIC